MPPIEHFLPHGETPSGRIESLSDSDTELLSKMFEWEKADDPSGFKDVEHSRLDKLLCFENRCGHCIVHKAAADESIKVLEFVLSRIPALINKVDGTNKRWTPLHHAANEGGLAAVEFLVQNGVNVMAKSSPESCGQTAVHQAAYRGRLPVVRFLTQKYPELQSTLDDEGNHPIHMAALGNSIEILEYFLDLGVDINLPDKCNRTCLHIAVNGNLEVVQWLVSKGADVYARCCPDEHHGDMPIHLAAYFGRLDVVQLFIENYADLRTAVNSDGDYPIHRVTFSTEVQPIVEYFLLLGVDVNVTDVGKRKRTWLHKAASAGDLGLVKYLVSKGANVHAKSTPADNEETAVHLAAFLGQLPVVKFFIEKYPSLKMSRNATGEWPIHKASIGGRTEVVEYFSEIGMDVNEPGSGKWQRTCLHKAAYKGHLGLVKWLVANGGDVYAKSSPDDDEDLPIHLAALFGQLAVVKFLVESHRDLLQATNQHGLTPLVRAQRSIHPFAASVAVWLTSELMKNS